MRRLSFIVTWSLVGVLYASAPAWAMQPRVTDIKLESDGTFTYSFTLKVDASVQLKCNGKDPDPDFFTIFNFDGLVKGSEKHPPGWTFATSEHGVTPIRGGRAVLDPVDTPGIPNLTWSCTGKDLAGGFELSGFSVRTKVKDYTTGEYGAQATKLEAGTVKPRDAAEYKESRIGAITVPSLKIHQ